MSNNTPDNITLEVGDRPSVNLAMGETPSLTLSVSTPTIGGGGGASDYRELQYKPQINDVTLNGNKTLSDLGITIYVDETVGDIFDDLTVSANALPSSSNPTVTKTGGSGTAYNINFGIPKGASGVYVGTGSMPADCNVKIDPTGNVINIQQTTGQSTTNLMSQKAITDAIAAVLQNTYRISVSSEEGSSGSFAMTVTFPNDLGNNPTWSQIYTALPNALLFTNLYYDPFGANYDGNSTPTHVSISRSNNNRPVFSWMGLYAYIDEYDMQQWCVDYGSGVISETYDVSAWSVTIRKGCY